MSLPDVQSEHDSLAATPKTAAGRERLLWTAVVVGVGLLVFALMVVSSFLPTRPDLQRVSVQDVLTSGTAPAERFGDHELRVVGWFVTLDQGCQGDTGGADTGQAPAETAETGTETELSKRIVSTPPLS